MIIASQTCRLISSSQQQSFEGRTKHLIKILHTCNQSSLNFKKLTSFQCESRSIPPSTCTSSYSSEEESDDRSLIPSKWIPLWGLVSSSSLLPPPCSAPSIWWNMSCGGKGNSRDRKKKPQPAIAEWQFECLDPRVPSYLMDQATGDTQVNKSSTNLRKKNVHGGTEHAWLFHAAAQSVLRALSHPVLQLEKRAYSSRSKHRPIFCYLVAHQAP